VKFARLNENLTMPKLREGVFAINESLAEMFSNANRKYILNIVTIRFSQFLPNDTLFLKKILTSQYLRQEYFPWQLNFFSGSKKNKK